MAFYFAIKAVAEVYWYLTISNKYPKNRRIAIKLTHAKYIVIALTVEADTSAIKACRLNYLGCGSINDYHIQSALTLALRKLAIKLLLPYY